jgi:DNA-binding XRE family transcriptional regulator
MSAKGISSEMKLTSFEELEDQYYGPVGTSKRDTYEAELQLELLAETIKQIRKQRNLTQEELGKLLGVQKAQISKLESGATNVTLDTLLKVFKALKAKVTLKVELEDEPVHLAI